VLAWLCQAPVEAVSKVIDPRHPELVSGS